MGNVLSFEKYKEQFYAEFDEYYSTYPIDVEKEIGKLDKEKRDENPCTEKRKVYELARKCKVHVFRNFPFYFLFPSSSLYNAIRVPKLFFILYLFSTSIVKKIINE